MEIDFIDGIMIPVSLKSVKQSNLQVLKALIGLGLDYHIGRLCLGDSSIKQRATKNNNWLEVEL